MSTDAETRESDLCVSRVPLFQGLSYEEQLDVAGVAQPTKSPGQRAFTRTGSGIYSASWWSTRATSDFPHHCQWS